MTVILTRTLTLLSGSCTSLPGQGPQGHTLQHGETRARRAKSKSTRVQKLGLAKALMLLRQQMITCRKLRMIWLHCLLTFQLLKQRAHQVLNKTDLVEEPRAGNDGLPDETCQVPSNEEIF